METAKRGHFEPAKLKAMIEDLLKEGAEKEKAIKSADSVEMKRGFKVEGLVVEETDEFVKVELPSGGYVMLKKSEIKSITRMVGEGNETKE